MKRPKLDCTTSCSSTLDSVMHLLISMSLSVVVPPSRAELVLMLGKAEICGESLPSITPHLRLPPTLANEMHIMLVPKKQSPVVVVLLVGHQDDAHRSIREELLRSL